jgi:pyruvate, orthophosphate dikinase
MKSTVKRRAAARPRAAGRRRGQRVWFFGAGSAEGDKDMKPLLGGKGANLAEMARLGLPVPPGFTISTDVCEQYWKDGGKLPEDLWDEVATHMRRVERVLGATFGRGPSPVLVSVRSGAAISMPGMMETVLNVGLNEETREALAAKTGNRRMALDSHRRLVQMFARVVLDLDIRDYERALESLKSRRGVQLDTELSADDLAELLRTYRSIFRERAGMEFPDDPNRQLRMAVEAVFRSWECDRARKYRELNRISGLKGTAVNVQAMVFGNMGDTSATGVCFTRDPSTGQDVFYGEFLQNAQGEDVVAGIRTPVPIAKMRRVLPRPYAELVRVKDLLERHYGDVQDMEFTVQEGRLWMLQTRTGKRTPEAAVRIAVEMVEDKRISKDTALLRIDAEVIDKLLHPTFDKNAKKDLLCKGLPASPGAATGRIVFDADDAEEWTARGEKVLLVRDETSPEDIGGMHVAQGILTSRGGMTSHAAVVARGMGKCCVVGCGAAQIDSGTKQMHVGERTFAEGDWLSIDGSTGEVMAGQVPTAQAKLSKHFRRIMEWADGRRRLAVRANAETPHDAEVARGFGAQGIGLCRTEHMFFDEERIATVREMILAEDLAGRERALAKLLPYQQKDFEEIFRAMDGLPVTIRLLDPPLHEFVPNNEKIQEETARALSLDVEKVRRRVAALHEMNPMMGHRGCRLGISYPEIYDMQVRAIAQAAVACRRKRIDVRPEIMIPLVGHVNELLVLRDNARRILEDTFDRAGTRVPYLLGTMIEVPRAALVAGEIAKEAEFFSFGTNDLTQMTFGFSRDDVNSFLPAYLEQKVLPGDPFQSLDTDGVGQLIRMAIASGRAVRTKLKVGICGEHGGDPRSIAFCHAVGMDYVSCSPYRVPVARLAAAQAAIRAEAAPSNGRKRR